MRHLALSVAATALVLAAAPSVSAREEGMWTFDNFPIARDRKSVV